ncbi:MAG: hypothetical protein QXH17_08140 [Candidatus Bathyarchaeia archaeon]
MKHERVSFEFASEGALKRSKDIVRSKELKMVRERYGMALKEILKIQEFIESLDC